LSPAQVMITPPSIPSSGLQPGDRVALRTSGQIVEFRTIGGISGAVVELAAAVVGPDGHVQGGDPVRVFVRDLTKVDLLCCRSL